MIPKKQLKFGRGNIDPRAEKVYLASVHQDWKLVQALIQEGAPCNYQSAWGRTALHSALFENHIASADSDLFEELVKASQSVINLGTSSGNTALHWACTFGTANEVEILLRNGANPSLKNNEGLTPLDVAREKHSQSIVDLLFASSPQ